MRKGGRAESWGLGAAEPRCNAHPESCNARLFGVLTRGAPKGARRKGPPMKGPLGRDALDLEGATCEQGREDGPWEGSRRDRNRVAGGPAA
jgi:hypothetical protein